MTEQIAGDSLLNLKDKISSKELEPFCQRYQVRRLSSFGLVLRDVFRPGSDIDVLIQFHPTARVSFLTLGKTQRQLSAIFQGPVDLMLQDGLKPLIRETILASAQEIYAA